MAAITTPYSIMMKMKPDSVFIAGFSAFNTADGLLGLLTTFCFLAFFFSMKKTKKVWNFFINKHIFPIRLWSV